MGGPTSRIHRALDHSIKGADQAVNGHAVLECSITDLKDVPARYEAYKERRLEGLEQDELKPFEGDVA